MIYGSAIANTEQNQCGENPEVCIPRELRHLSYAIYPSSPEYNTARLNFNKRFIYFPKAIFYPRTYEEAQFVLRAIRRHNLKFAVRSGAHCFEPGSLSPDYVFDVSKFNSIIPNIAKEQVHIGAGCLLKDVIDRLGAINYAIPTGTCPTVGVTGLTLGGGIGLLSRPLGLTCDSVKSITLLTAEGEIIEVTASSYPDLYWALLGGGNGSYGIALRFTFKMHYIPEVTYYELSWEFDSKKIPAIMAAWQKFVETLPDNISSSLALRHPDHFSAVPLESPPLITRIYGIKVGSEPFNEWKHAFKDLKPRVFKFKGRYVETTKFWSKESPLPFNKSKSRILMKPMTPNVIKKVTRFFKELEKRNPNYLVYFEFDALGGKVPNNKTSFYPRNAFGWWYQAYYWGLQEQNAEILSLSRKFYSEIPHEVSKYCYANIVDYDLGEKYLKRYYGNHVDRLIEVKDKYDPTSFFHWRQSIPTCEHYHSSSSCSH